MCLCSMHWVYVGANTNVFGTIIHRTTHGHSQLQYMGVICICVCSTGLGGKTIDTNTWHYCTTHIHSGHMKFLKCCECIRVVPDMVVLWSSVWRYIPLRTFTVDTQPGSF